MPGRMTPPHRAGITGSKGSLWIEAISARRSAEAGCSDVALSPLDIGLEVLLDKRFLRGDLKNVIYL